MAETIVNVTFGVESLVPDVTSVPVVAGDSVTFRNQADIGATLFANAEAAGILTPSVGAEGITVAPGGSTTLSFAANGSGIFAILIQVEGLPEPPPTVCTLPPSPVLMITDAKTGWPADGGAEEAGTKQSTGG